jgi:hypothetical protein
MELKRLDEALASLDKAIELTALFQHRAVVNPE